MLLSHPFWNTLILYTLPLINNLHRWTITCFEMYHMSTFQAALNTFAVSLVSWTVWHVRCLHIVHVIYFEFLVSVTHAPVLSSSTTTLAIFAHSLIPWPSHSGLFDGFRTLMGSMGLSVVVPFQTLQSRIGTFLSFVRLTDLRENPSACSWEALVSVGWRPKSPSTAGEFWIS